MQKAIADAYAKGFLGKNIFGSGKNFDVLLARRRGSLRSWRRIRADGVARRQARDSAHSASLPCGGRALGRADRHQQRRNSGCVPHIIDGGAEWYANLGTPKNGGTRLFCLSGHLNKPGVYELPMGYNLKKMIYEVGGGMPDGKRLESSRARRIELPISYRGRNRHRHGFRFADESRLDAGFRRSGRARRNDLHGEVRAAHHGVLSA